MTHHPRHYPRREFLGAMAGGAAALLGCRTDPPGGPGSARLNARPGIPSSPAGAGQFPLGLGGSRDGLLYVPPSYEIRTASPLMLGLHGAGGSASGPANLLRSYADEFGFVLLTVDSRSSTWDGVLGRYGDDVDFINLALQRTFERYAIDPARVFVEGFSDGASYALGLGLANGDLIRRIVAFSPGFIPPSDSAAQGKPAVFISHGTADQILPITTTRDNIVPALTRQGYAVTYQEFDGGHQVPADVARAAVTWAFT